MGEVIKFPEPENLTDEVISHIEYAHLNNDNIYFTVTLKDQVTGISWEIPVPNPVKAKIIKLVLDDFKKFLRQDN